MGCLMWDVVVVGLGAVGAAAMRCAAEQGARVLGIELDLPAHQRGSSHGHVRIFRHAYFEHPDYVPLLQHSTTRFESLERITGRELLHRCGVVMLGDAASTVVARTLATAQTHALAVEHLDRDGLAKRFPCFAQANVGSNSPETSSRIEQGVFEANAGLVRPEAAIDAALELARAHGAETRLHTRVLNLIDEDGSVTVVTSHERLRAHHVIIAAGSWAPKLLPELAPFLRVTRQVQAWVAPREASIAALERLPCWFLDRGPLLPALYGVPTDPRGSEIAHRFPKVAFHGSESQVDPDVGAAPITPAELAILLEAYRRLAPSLVGLVQDSSTCLYTMSPDAHAMIGHSRQSEKVHFVAGLSGHGFKLSPALGDAVTELALNGRTKLPIDFLRSSRFV